MLGGLRYNRVDLLELIGRKSMITRTLAAKRFPGFKLGEELDRIHNLDALQRLGLEVSDLSGAETLKRRVDELVQAELAVAK
jgi:hypothetical protein